MLSFNIRRSCSTGNKLEGKKKFASGITLNSGNIGYYVLSGKLLFAVSDLKQSLSYHL